jgi:hypothetical protein
MKMWPYNPGGRWWGGPYKKGTTVCASSCRVYKVTAKFNMYTSRCVVVYIIIHMIISAFGVFVNTFRLPDHIPWVSTPRCETIRPKRDRFLRRSKRHRSLALPYMLRNVLPGDCRGAWQRRAPVAVGRTIMGCADYVALSKSNPKKCI